MSKSEIIRVRVEPGLKRAINESAKIWCLTPAEFVRVVLAQKVLTPITEQPAAPGREEPPQ